MLKLQHVSFRYGESEWGVFDIDLRVKPGECVVLIGESGCGKTTMTRLVNGLAPSYYFGERRGEIFIGGRLISMLPIWEVGQAVGSVFQDPSRQFFSSELPGEVAFACENHGFSQDVIRQRTDHAIRKLRLAHLKERPLDALSGGEKQRTAIASVYALRPSLYALDEPTANLDSSGVTQLKETLYQLKKEGSSLLVAEHRLSWLDGLADRYVYMEAGRIKGEYLPREMKNMTAVQLESMGLRAVGLRPMASFAVSDDGKSPAIQVKQLCCRRGKTVIWQSLSFQAPSGRITALTGRNGIGKTTIGLALSGLIGHQSGAICIEGEKMQGRKLRQRVYYCSNNTGTQFFTNSVSEELLLSSRPSEKNVFLAREMLRRLKLYPWKDAHPANLSGGQRQRLAVACALLSEKPILVLDEPTSGLDGRNMRLVAEELKAAAQSGKTILVITHDEELINACCQGRIDMEEAG